MLLADQGKKLFGIDQQFGGGLRIEKARIVQFFPPIILMLKLGVVPGGDDQGRLGYPCKKIKVEAVALKHDDLVFRLIAVAQHKRQLFRAGLRGKHHRSAEQKSKLQALLSISYTVLCLK